MRRPCSGDQGAEPASVRVIDAFVDTTQRWRKADSNCWSLSRGCRADARRNAFMSISGPYRACHAHPYGGKMLLHAFLRVPLSVQAPWEERPAP
jgi:hypothetical protein